MSRLLYFISHPNVVIDPVLPVPRWPLSQTGRARMLAGLAQPWVREITAVYTSTEQKAVDAAEILANHLAIRFAQEADLGENDRSSTGFLEPEEFERVANEFFKYPDKSVRGWERAADAQARIVSAVTRIARSDQTQGSIAIVSHGAVGTLLHCSLAGNEISRRWDQPANGGGNFYPFTLDPPAAHAWWSAVDLGAA
jgi:broad specificity phosphatase PhoE